MSPETEAMYSPEEIKLLTEPSTQDIVFRLCRIAGVTARAHGFGPWVDDAIPACLALVHSEVTEALVEFRKTAPRQAMPESFFEELADIVIRVIALIDDLGASDEFATILLQKMLTNMSRPYRHGGKRL